MAAPISEAALDARDWPHRGTPPLRLALIGGFNLTYRGEPVRLTPASQRLLALLALHVRPLLRTFVAGTLWSDVSDERAAASLRTTLWRLGRTGHRLVEATSHALRMGPDLVVDYRRSLKAGRALVDDEDEGGDAREAAAAAWQGLLDDLLPTWGEEWVAIERERFHQLRLDALETLSQRLTREGRHPEALQVGLAAAAAEPLRESAQRTLIRVHLAQGNVGSAVHRYRAYRDLLKDELGVDPSRQIEALIGEIPAARDQV